MRIIDISHDLENGMIKFSAPWHIHTEISELGRINEVGRNTKKVIFSSHAGTHMDAPLHFIENGRSVEKLDLNTLVGEVSILDLTFLNENEPVTINMLKKFDLSDRIILKFGWWKWWNTDKFYIHYPYLSDEAAQYLVDSGVKLIGMDTPSPDCSDIKSMSKDDSKVHKLLLSNEIIIVEYLNLREVTDYSNWMLAALPLKIKGSDGAPSRVVLFKED